MDSDQAANPPDTLGPHNSSSPMFSCFLDCCKPKKGITSQEADEDHVTLAMKNEELRAKEKVKLKDQTSSGAVVPAKSALSPKAVVEFLKMLLSFLLFESLGRGTKTKTKSEDSAAKLNDKVTNEDLQ